MGLGADASSIRTEGKHEHPSPRNKRADAGVRKGSRTDDQIDEDDPIEVMVAGQGNSHDDGRSDDARPDGCAGLHGLAGTGIGAPFDLGKTNTVNAVTRLVGSVGGPSLTIDNNSTIGAATALNLQVEAGKAPMKVNSGAKVADLHADKVDGKSVSEIG